MTTNSSAGIEDYGVYYPVFKAMEEEGMVLNLHGEVPSDPEKVRCHLVAHSEISADCPEHLSAQRREALPYPSAQVICRLPKAQNSARARNHR